MTGYGIDVTGQVVKVLILDRDQVENLARALCSEGGGLELCNKIDRTAIAGVGFAAQQKWEREVRRNGGFCDACAEFAGKIVARFDVTAREYSDAV